MPTLNGTRQKKFTLWKKIIFKVLTSQLIILYENQVNLNSNLEIVHTHLTNSTNFEVLINQTDKWLNSCSALIKINKFNFWIFRAALMSVILSWYWSVYIIAHVGSCDLLFLSHNLISRVDNVGDVEVKFF